MRGNFSVTEKTTQALTGMGWTFVTVKMDGVSGDIIAAGFDGRGEHRILTADSVGGIMAQAVRPTSRHMAATI